MVNIGMALFSFFFIPHYCRKTDNNTNCFKKNALKMHFKFTMVYAETKSKLFLGVKRTKTAF